MKRWGRQRPRQKSDDEGYDKDTLSYVIVFFFGLYFHISNMQSISEDVLRYHICKMLPFYDDVINLQRTCKYYSTLRLYTDSGHTHPHGIKAYVNQDMHDGVFYSAEIVHYKDGKRHGESIEQCADDVSSFAYYKKSVYIHGVVQSIISVFPDTSTSVTYYDGSKGLTYISGGNRNRYNFNNFRDQYRVTRFDSGSTKYVKYSDSWLLAETEVVEFDEQGRVTLHTHIGVHRAIGVKGGPKQIQYTYTDDNKVRRSFSGYGKIRKNRILTRADIENLPTLFSLTNGMLV